MTPVHRARILAPAKINLGLEVIRRRNDGYHDIRSILAMVDLADELEIVISDHPGTRVAGMPDVPAGDNLIVRAADRFTAATGIPAGYDIAVTKHIPSPAGLGGASADAAATLVALNALHGEPLGVHELAAAAAGLGSDVPFFIRSTVAKVSGRGIELVPLPSIDGTMLIAAPKIAMAAKTATLYRMLTPADMTDGSRVEALAGSITAGVPIDPALLGNAFARPLMELVPEVARVKEQMQQAGCPAVALSGAGPAHYALFRDKEQAATAAHRLRDAVGPGVAVHVARFRQHPLRAVIEDHEAFYADRTQPDATRARP